MLGLLDRLRRHPFAPTPLTSTEWSRADWFAERRLKLLKAGELEEDAVAPGVIETHWAARRPRATHTMPDGPGWWATRLEREEQWSIVEVVMDLHQQLWWSYGPREPAKQVLHEADRLWSDKMYEVPR